MTSPTVTVCICTIPGREDLLKRAVTSVAAQTVLPDEVVIHLDVDRVGAAGARNAATARADTDYVAWLDDDDEFLPRHLEVCLQTAVETDADVIYPWMLVDPPHADTLRCVGPDRHVVSPFGLPFSDVMRRQLEMGHNFLHLTGLIRLAAIRAVGGFVALGPRGSEEDAGLYQALAGAGRSFVHVPDRTWVWHRGVQSTGGRGVKAYGRPPPQRSSGPLDFDL